MMTDFLSGLLDRALNRTPVLQPRRPSLFEASPAGLQVAGPVKGPLWWQRKENPGLDLETAEMHESPDVHQFAVPPQASASPQSIVSPPAPLMDLAQRTAIAAVPHHQKTDDDPQKMPGDLVERQMPKSIVLPIRHRTSDHSPAETHLDEHQIKTDGPVDRPRILTESKHKPERLQVEAEEEAGIQQLVRRERSIVAPKVKLDREQEIRPQPLALHQARPSEIRRVKELLAPQIRLQERIAQPPIVPLSSSTSTPRPALSSRQPAMWETRHIEPAIQVTIGRIEIRGSLPAPVQTSVPRPTRPKLGLEDYLRSRSGGAK